MKVWKHEHSGGWFGMNERHWRRLFWVRRGAIGLIAAFFISSFVLPRVVDALRWTTENTDIWGTTIGLSAGLDSGGSPVFSSFQNDAVSYHQKSGDQWSRETVETALDFDIERPGIAMNGSTPAIAAGGVYMVRDGGVTNGLAPCDDADWSCQTLAVGLSAYISTQADIVIRAGTPVHVFDYSKEALTISSRDGNGLGNAGGGAWYQKTMFTSGVKRQYPSVVIYNNRPLVFFYRTTTGGASGELYMAYCDSNCGDLGTGSSATWAEARLDNAVANVGRHTAAFTQGGTAFVTYEDVTNGAIKIATCSTACTNNANWSTTSLASLGSGSMPDIVMDASGRPRVSYYTGAQPQLASCNSGCTASGNWSSEPIDASPDATGNFNTSMAVGADGTTHVIYGTRVGPFAWTKYATGRVNEAPTVSALTVSGVGKGLAANGTGLFTASVQVSDTNGDPTRLKMEYSQDGGGTWKDPILVTSGTAATNGSPDTNNGNVYQIGTGTGIVTSGGANTITFVWDTRSTQNETGALTTAPTQTVRLRVTPFDGESTGASVTSGDIVLDNAAPTGLVSVVTSTPTDTSMRVLWTQASDANFDHYEVWVGTDQTDVLARSGSAREWDQDQDASLATSTVTSTTVTGLTSGTTYFFALWAVDAWGNEASLGAGGIRQAKTTGEAPLAGPAGLALGSKVPRDVSVGGTSASSITVTWTPTTAALFDRYDVWYGTNSADVTARMGTARMVDTNRFPSLRVQGTSSVTIADLSAGTTYHVMVRAQYTDGTGESSGVLSATTSGGAPTAGIESVGVVVTTPRDATPSPTTEPLGDFRVSGLSSNTIQVSWQPAGEAGFDRYELWTATSEDDLSKRTGTARLFGPTQDSALRTASTPAQTISGLASGTKYFIQLFAYFKSGTSLSSGVVSQTTLATGTLPTEETKPLGNLRADTVGSTSVRLTWNPATRENFDQYKVWVATSRADMIARTGSARSFGPAQDSILWNATTASFLVTGLVPSTSYEFQVEALVVNGDPVRSSILTQTTRAEGESAPSGRQATWTFSDGQTITSTILSRTDQEYTAFIESVRQQCAAISSTSYRWRDRSGDAASMDFGVPDCSGVITPEIVPTGAIEYVWRFADKETTTSSILNRTDQAYLDMISSIDAQCRRIPSTKMTWREGSGDRQSLNFGLPSCGGEETVVPPAPAPGTTSQREIIDDTQAEFSAGRMTGMSWHAPGQIALTNAARDPGTGTFTSTVKDAGFPVTWDRLSWTPLAPAGKPLPDAAAEERGYPGDNVSMRDAVALYHMDEAAWGNEGRPVRDASGNNQHGSRSGSARPDPQGLFGGAGFFDGKTGYVNISQRDFQGLFGDRDAVSPESFTVEAWLKADQKGRVAVYNGWSGEFSLGTSDAGGFVMWVHSGREAPGEAGDRLKSLSLWDRVRTTKTYLDGKWHHVVATYQWSPRKEDSHLTLAVDGEVQAQASLVNLFAAIEQGKLTLEQSKLASTTTTYHPATLGAITQDFPRRREQFWSGSMDEVAVYRRALTTEEIQARYRRGVRRVQFQVRSCDDSACAGETFVGPDGTANTWYTEATNTTAMTPSVVLHNLPKRRYFQYRASVETDDPAVAVGMTRVAIGYGVGARVQVPTPTEAARERWVETSSADWQGGERNGATFFGIGEAATVQLERNGQSIEQVTLPTRRTITDSQFAGADDGWAVGAGGTMLRWNGTTWTEVSPRVTAEDLWNIEFPTANDGWAVGSHGTILRRLDGEWRVWQQSDLGIEAIDLSGIAFASEADGWAYGEQGTVLRWNGVTWTRVTPNPFAGVLIYDMLFRSPTDGWAVGNNGKIFHWDGTAWTEETVTYSDGSPVTESFVTLGRGRGSDILAAGDFGVLFRFHDGVWASVPTFTEATLLDIVSQFGGRIWVIGSGGTLLESVDGVTWIPIDLPSTDTFFTSAFSDGTQWLFGMQGAALKVDRTESERTGIFESAVHDAGAIPSWDTLRWEGSDGSDGSACVQFATSDAFAGPWVYRGPDGATTGCYRGASQHVWLGHSTDGQRYARYRVTLTTGGASTVYPFVSAVAVDYSYDRSGVFFAPTPVEPRDGAFMRTVPVLYWTVIPQATEYDVEIRLGGTVLSTMTTDSAYTELPTDLFAMDGVYLWRVRARRSDAESPWSQSFSFRLDRTAPGRPILVRPEGTVREVPTTMEWIAVSDASMIEVQVGAQEASSFTNPIVATAVPATETLVDVTQVRFVNGGTYRWRARAIDRANNKSVWSESLFTIAVPVVPPRIAPTAIVATVDQGRLRVTWEATLQEGETFAAEVRRCDTTQTPAVCTTNIADAERFTASLFEADLSAQPQGQYVARVFVVNRGGRGPAAEEFFTIGSVEPPSPLRTWRYRTPMTFSPTETDGVPVLLSLSPEVFSYARANADGADLRVAEHGSDTLLPYWIEVWNPRGVSRVWTRVPRIGTASVDLLYGNADAGSAADGVATFDFFDDFTTGGGSSFGLAGAELLDPKARAGWTAQQGVWRVADGVLNPDGSSLSLLTVDEVISRPGFSFGVRVQHGAERQSPTLLLGWQGDFRDAPNVQDETVSERPTITVPTNYYAMSRDGESGDILLVSVANGDVTEHARVTPEQSFVEGAWYQWEMAWESPTVLSASVRDVHGQRVASATMTADQEWTNGLFGVLTGGAESHVVLDDALVRRLTAVTPPTPPRIEEEPVVVEVAPRELGEGPSLTSPDTDARVNVQPTLSWSVVPDAGRYEVVIATDTSFASASLLDQRSITGTQLTAPVSTARDATYFWRVRATAVGATPSAWSETGSWTKDASAPAAPILTQPENAAVVTGTITFAWDAPADADIKTYDVQVTGVADDRFASPAWKEKTEATSVVMDAVADGIYLWRVRAVDTTGNKGAWVVGTFTTLQLPASPIITNPTESFTIARAEGIGLTWTWPEGSAQEMATVEVVRLNVQGDFVEEIMETTHEGVTDAMQPFVVTPKERGLYAIRVKGVNAVGESPWVLTPNFLVTAPAPIISAPEDRAIVTTFPTVVWTAVDEADAYTVTLLHGSTLVTQATTKDLFLDIAAFPFATGLPDGEYSVQVIPVMTKDPGLVTAAERIFTRDTAIPVSPTGLAPTGTVTILPETFVWDVAVGAVAYDIEVGQRDAESLETPLLSMRVTEPIAPAPLSLKDGVYLWRVRARSRTDVVGPWADGRLEIRLPIVAPTIVPIEVTAKQKDDAVIVTWDATLGEGETFTVQLLRDATVITEQKGLVITEATFDMAAEQDGEYMARVFAANTGGNGPPIDISFSMKRKDVSLTVFDEWTNRRTMTIDATPVDDFQVRIDLTPATFDYTFAAADGADLRIADMSGHALPYWIETWNPNEQSTLWVKVKQAGTTTLEFFTGNPEAAPVSDGHATFEFFDDFQAEGVGAFGFSSKTKNDPDLHDRWTVESGSWTVGGGLMKNWYGDDRILIDPIAFGPGYTVRAKVSERGNWRYPRMIVGWQDANNYYDLEFDSAGKGMTLSKVVNDVRVLLDRAREVPIAAGSWYWLEVRWVSSTRLVAVVTSIDGTPLATVDSIRALGGRRGVEEGWTTGSYALAGTRGASAVWFDDVQIRKERAMPARTHQLDASTYSRSVMITPATPVDAYQVKVVLTPETFDYIKAQANLDEPHSRTNGADLRFVDANGTNLPYWIESWDPQGTSVVWVRVAEQGTSEMTMRYGDPAAQPASDGPATFEVFDDFNGPPTALYGTTSPSSDQWEAPLGEWETILEHGALQNTQQHGTDVLVARIESVALQHAIRVKMREDAWGHYPQVMMGWKGEYYTDADGLKHPDNHIAFEFDGGSGFLRVWKVVQGTRTAVDMVRRHTGGEKIEQGKWYWMELRWDDVDRVTAELTDMDGKSIASFDTAVPQIKPGQPVKGIPTGILSEGWTTGRVALRAGVRAGKVKFDDVSVRKYVSGVTTRVRSERTVPPPPLEDPVLIEAPIDVYRTAQALLFAHVPDAEEYIVRARGTTVDVDESFTMDAATAVVGSTLTFEPPVDRAWESGTYRWSVTARGKGRTSNSNATSARTTYTIDATAPRAVTLQTPRDGRVVEQVSVFEWKRDSRDIDISTYELAVTNESDTTYETPFMTFVGAEEAAPVTDDVTFTPGAYRWRVRATDARGNQGPWSEQTYAISEPPAPSAPILINPPTGIVRASHPLTWAHVADGVQYEVAVHADTPLFDATYDVSTDATVGNLVSFTLPGETVVADGTYTFTVVAIDAAGRRSDATAENAGTTYTIDATGPEAPTNIQPASGSVHPVAPSITWDGPIDAASYGVDVARAEDTTYADIVARTPLPQGERVFTPEITDGAYRARVQAFDAVGNPGVVAETLFAIQYPPDTPRLIEPKEGAVINGQSLILEWTDVTADNYDIEVTHDATVQVFRTDTTEQRIEVEDEGAYAWRVRGVRGEIVGQYSPVGTFAVDLFQDRAVDVRRLVVSRHEPVQTSVERGAVAGIGIVPVARAEMKELPAVRGTTIERAEGRGKVKTLIRGQVGPVYRLESVADITAMRIGYNAATASALVKPGMRLALLSLDEADGTWTVVRDTIKESDAMVMTSNIHEGWYVVGLVFEQHTYPSKAATGAPADVNMIRLRSSTKK